MRLLNEAGIRYLVIGGYAVVYHGYNRPTGDIDVWVDGGGATADALVGILRDFGFDVPGLSRDLFIGPGRITRMGVEPMRIEITTSIKAMDFDQCYRRRVVGELDGVPVSLINLVDLKANKAAVGRHKDLDDVERLP